MDGSKMRRSRAVKSRAVVIASLAVLLACVDWNTFSQEFRRSQGWKDHDGGSSTWIPPVGGGEAGGRSLWLFGDGAFWRAMHAQDPNAFPGNGCAYGACRQLDPSAPYIPDPNLHALIGNTAAVHSWAAGEAPWKTPSNLSFYARKKRSADAGDCGAVASSWHVNCPVTAIDTSAQIPGNPDDLQKSGGFFPKLRDTGTGETLQNHTDQYVWPTGAVYVSNPKYPAGYVVPELFASYAPTTPQPFLVIGYQRKGPDAHLQARGFGVITDVTAGDPTRWSYRAIADIPGDESDWQISWGNGLYYDKEHDRIRIYGEIMQEIDRPATWQECLATPEGKRRCFAKDMVLAVAWHSHDIVDPSRWYYAYEEKASVQQGCAGQPYCRPCQQSWPNNPELWSRCYAPVPPTSPHLKAQLKHVARNIAGDFTVDRICHDQAGSEGRPSITGPAGCAWVLTHGAWRTENGCRPPLGNEECAMCVDDVLSSNPRWIMVRTTDDDFDWPPASHGRHDVARKRSTYVSDAIGDLWDRPLLCGENEGRQVRQLLAHDELSPPGTLAISWYINAAANHMQNLWPDGDTTKLEKDRRANLRFGALELNKFLPWCTATNTCPADPQPSCAPPGADLCCGSIGQGCCASGNACAQGLSCRADPVFGVMRCLLPQ